MRDSVLVAPGVALEADVLSTPPVLELAKGQLEVVELSRSTDTPPLRQAVRAIVPVPLLGLVLVATDDELYLLPLMELMISMEETGA
jgi:hypothetical protein